MDRQGPWFYPGIGFFSYVKKYPFVLLFGFLYAIGSGYQMFFSRYFPTFSVSIDFYNLLDSFLLGISFFALLHQWLASPRLKNFKYRSAAYALGFAVVEAAYFYFNSDYSLSPSHQRLLHFVSLTALLFPLTQREYSPEKLWAFVVNLIQGLAAAYLLLFLVDGVVRSLLPFFPQLQYSGNQGLIFPITRYLVISWYLLGVLEKSFYAPEEKGAGNTLTGSGWLAGALLVLGGGYLFEFIKSFHGYFAVRWFQNYLVDERIFFFALAFYKTCQKTPGF